MKVGHLFFKYRSYTPIPLLIAVLLLAEPTWWSLGGGYLLAWMGEAIRIWAVRYAGSATRTTGRVGGDELVTAGPFAYVRNPLYLGNFLLSLGVCVMAWAWMPWMLVVYGTLFAVQYEHIISLEEEYLREKFGLVYAEYTESVPRFIPRLTPSSQTARVPDPLRKTLRTESNTLASFTVVSIVVLVLKLL